MPKTFEQLMATEVVGNYSADGPLQMELDSFIANERNPLEQRAAAVRRFDEIVGYTEAEREEDAALVDEFMNNWEG